MPTIEGPDGPIAYTRDEWGTPRFEVKDQVGAAHARGYFHALDRLVQIRLTLAAGRGQMMAILGEQPLGRLVDRSARLLGLAEGLDAEVEALSDETAEFVQAYCNGFNQGMADRGRPFVSWLIGVDNTPYTPQDVVLVYRTACWFGLSSLTMAARVATAQWMSDGASPELMDLLLGPEGAAGLDHDLVRDLPWPEPYALRGVGAPRGSNAFAVSAARSKTGGALLMSEFHMEVCRLPPVMHISHAQLPDDYVQGASVPGLPLVSAGRTRRVGWGFTFGHADQIDITVQQCRDGERRVGEAWLPLRKRVDTVKVRGGAEEQWPFWSFTGGTLLSDPSGPEKKVYGLGWRGLGQTHEDLNTHLPLLAADSVDTLVELMRQTKAVSVAGTFVDRSGRIGWAQSGRVPERRAGWGPRPGWDRGDDPDVECPTEVDPPGGYVASANERTNGWTSFPEARYRHERLCELLGTDDPVGPEDLLRFSYDEQDPCAARLLPVWRGHLPDNPDGKLLADWDGSGGNRRAHGLFHALHHELVTHLVAGHLGEAVAQAMFDDQNLIVQLQDRLDDALALETDHLDEAGLARAISDCWLKAVARADEDRMAGPVDAPFKNILTQGKLPKFFGFSTAVHALPGGPTSLFASRRNVFLGEKLVSGPAFHILIDMAQDGLRYNIAGGASERRMGPGYAAGIDAWLTGDLKRLV